VRIKRIKITVESYEVLVIRRRGGLGQLWCATCCEQVAAISFSVVTASGLSAETIRLHMEAGRLHMIETVGGSPLICLKSLIQNLKEMSQ
jgi:hypothetical protein